RQPITWIEGLRSEPTVGEGASESLLGLVKNRLGAVECHLPVREIQLSPFTRADLTDTEVIGEIRPAADRSFVMRDRLQPSRRTLQKRDGRHEGARKSYIQRMKYSPYQPHIVIYREPTDKITFRGGFNTSADQPSIMNQILMAQHDTFRFASRAGSVLQKG